MMTKGGSSDSTLVHRKERSGDTLDAQHAPSETLDKLKTASKKHHKLVLFECTCREIMFNDNPYLLTGYREETENSFLKCFFTLFTLHNDTLNVWTHLLGGFGSLYLIYDAVCVDPIRKLQADDIGAFVSYLMLSALCLFASALYHLCRTHSVEAYVVLLTCDIIGITLQIFGCTFLLVWFEMNCFVWWRNIYLVYLCCLALVTAFYVPYLVRNRKTSMRTFLLVCFALTGVICWTHHFYLAGGHFNPHNLHTLLHLAATYAWVGFGLVIRRIRIPELWAPGWFDIWFSSHQLFHVTTVLGSYTLYLSYYQLAAEGALNTCREGEYF